MLGTKRVRVGGRLPPLPLNLETATWPRQWAVRPAVEAFRDHLLSAALLRTPPHSESAAPAATALFRTPPTAPPEDSDVASGARLPPPWVRMLRPGSPQKPSLPHLAGPEGAEAHIRSSRFADRRAAGRKSSGLLRPAPPLRAPPSLPCPSPRPPLPGLRGNLESLSSLSPPKSLNPTERAAETPAGAGATGGNGCVGDSTGFRTRLGHLPARAGLGRRRPRRCLGAPLYRPVAEAGPGSARSELARRGATRSIPEKTADSLDPRKAN